MGNSTTIFLVDKDVRRRAAIVHSLSTVGIHAEPYEDFSELIERWPNSGMLFVHDDGISVANILQEMGKAGRWMPVVGYACEPSTKQVVKAVLDGAIDFICWPSSAEEICNVISQAHLKAETFGSVKMREALARSRVEKLTRREREVLISVADGFSNRIIGERLLISPRTVEIHRANMLSKLGVSHTSEAIRIAIEADLPN